MSINVTPLLRLFAFCRKNYSREERGREQESERAYSNFRPFISNWYKGVFMPSFYGKL
jgi:hypothetical protein